MAEEKRNEESTKINEDKAILQNMSDVKHILVIMSGKGGVGKSTVAANLAFAIMWRGKITGILDVDIHGPTIPKLLGIEGEQLIASEKKRIMPVIIHPNLKVVSMGFLLQDSDQPIVWRGPLKMGAIRQFLSDVEWNEVDYLIIDLPPGTGDEPLSIAQLLPKRAGAIIVTTPQDIALLNVRKSINFARLLNMPVVGIIENMSGFICPHCGKKIDIFGSGGGIKAALDFNIKFLGRISLNGKIAERSDEGKPFIVHERDSRPGKEFMDIVSEIEKRVEELGI